MITEEKLRSPQRAARDPRHAGVARGARRPDARAHRTFTPRGWVIADHEPPRWAHRPVRRRRPRQPRLRLELVGPRERRGHAVTRRGRRDADRRGARGARPREPRRRRPVRRATGPRQRGRAPRSSPRRHHPVVLRARQGTAARPAGWQGGGPRVQRRGHPAARMRGRDRIVPRRRVARRRDVDRSVQTRGVPRRRQDID